MGKELRFDDKVVIVTGAGNGLGRSHALAFASRGAKVVVNDLGGDHTGSGKSARAADTVVEEIRAQGGEAVASYDSVVEGDRIVQCALDAFGRIDVVINNAGILRDVSFHKMTDEDWDLVYQVHVLGTYKVTKAAWPHLRDQSYGRVVMTSSAAGIYGNFGQANYGMAKLGVAGLASTLAVEGRKKNVFVNTIAPVAGSRMTETVLPKELLESLDPAYVSPLVVWLAHEQCEENGGLFEVGGGFFGKLRWERSGGLMFRVGRTIRPEDVRDRFDQAISFEDATHPADLAASLQPIMRNIEAGPSKGGNEWIDVDRALGYELPETTSQYDERDLALYALGVGAGRNPLEPADLRHVYELSPDGFVPLPTYAVVPAVNQILELGKNGITAPGLSYGLDRVLHGEQYTRLLRPLPNRASLTHRAVIKDIFDKGKGALVITEITSADETGEPLMINEVTTFVRGAGGWGGDRGPSADVNVPPDRAPDAVVEEKTDDHQALLYRLSGDWNPLHADPGFAQAFGFDRPILHGLCSFGYAGRHVLSAFAPGGDARYFESIKVRFADSVFPGETLVTEMWKDGDRRVVFRTKVKERDKVVLSNAAVEFFETLPRAKPKPEALAKGGAKAGTAQGPAEVTTADVFHGLGRFVEAHPELVDKVQKVFQFAITSPDSVWTVDLKNGRGAVVAGAEPAPDTTLELSNDDWLCMIRGEADPQKLYFGGKLKIGGDVMASQKLEFLKKVDPSFVTDAMRDRLGGAVASAGDPGTGGPAAQASRSADVFVGIQIYVEQHPELAERVKSVFLFKLTDPVSAWTIDLKSGGGSVQPGEVGVADCTLELAESDFMAMTRGEADPQKLYFGGKLKISGNVMASQKLDFLTKIDPKAVASEVAKRKAAGTAASAPVAPKAARTKVAKAVFDKLAKRLEEHPELAQEVGVRIELVVDEERAIVDLRSSPGTVEHRSATDGAAADGVSPAAVLSLTDIDFEALVSGAESAQSLYQRGRLRVDGDVTVAHRLGFLKQLA